MPDEPIPDSGRDPRPGIAASQGLTPSLAPGSSKGSAAWQPPDPQELQKDIPQYKVLDLIGHGGMGAVYKGWQVSLERYVAIKVLPPGMDDGDAQFVVRFKQEAKTMAKFMHPGIVGVFDAGETSTGLLYIVMEFVEGTDVAQMVKSQGKLSADHALAIAAHVCDALQYAHTRSVIHRDIKPANIMVNTEGQVKVADFGLAKASEAGGHGLTKTNMAMGTPDYIAPECLITGITADHRADLYAVGVMLYNMLTGDIPRGRFKPASEKVRTDPRFDAIVNRAMQNEREERYQSAQEIRRDLDVILSSPMTQEEPQAAAPPAQAPPARKPASRPAASQSPPPRGANVSMAGKNAGAPSKSSTGLIAGIIGVVVIIGIGSFFAFKKPSGGDIPVTATAAAAPAEGWTNLLAITDVKRDALMDPWTLENGALRSPRRDVRDEESPGSHQMLAFPLPNPPRNYDLRYRITRNARGFAVCVPFARGDERGDLRIDGGQGFRLFSQGMGKERQSKLWLAVGEPHDLLVEVRETRVRISLDGALQVDHEGRLPGGKRDGAFFPASKVDHPFIGIGVCGGDITVHSAELREVGLAALNAAAGGKTISLLQLVDLNRDVTNGTWKNSPYGVVLTAPSDFGVLELPYEAPEEYDFEAEFTPVSGSFNINFYLRAGGRSFTWKLNAHGRTRPIYGFDTLDGKLMPARTEAVATSPLSIENQKRYSTRVEVRRGSLRAFVNGTEILQWSGDFNRFSMEAGSTLRNPRALGVGSYKRGAIFHRVEVREITGTGKITAP